jgi:hypothetical protein
MKSITSHAAMEKYMLDLGENAEGHVSMVKFKNVAIKKLYQLRIYVVLIKSNPMVHLFETIE